MNWSGFFIVIGLVGLAFFTMPFGLAILAGIYWVYSRG